MSADQAGPGGSEAADPPHLGGGPIEVGGGEPAGGEAAGGTGFRSGFVALVGRPNVGKSTLLNRILGTKVTIVSDKPQTTRHEIRGILTRPDAQIVFVDTPGVHKPRTALGERLNETAAGARAGVDVVCLLIDGRAGYGTGDRRLAQDLEPERTVVVVNKVDGLSPPRVLAQLSATSALDASAYFAVSAQTGKGVRDLVEHLVSRLPEGPHWYPEDVVTDVPDEQWVAELVREQLLRATREEVPHSVATRVVEWEWPRVRVEILVERESQKGIVIGKGGAVLKEVGTRVRRQLPKGAFVELFVTVDRDWQRRPGSLDRLGY